MELKNKRVLVVGLGKTGLATARFLLGRGAQVTLNDVRPQGEVRDAVDTARGLGAELVLGRHPDELFTTSDLIVVSPGVPNIEPLKRAASAGVPIVSEVELASYFIEAPIVGVTGTNGKSTVTSLLGQMCRIGGRDVFVGGNLGTPLVDAVGTSAAAANGLLVVELSSFQLERVDRFRAHIGVLLNITADHLDRYDSFDAYAATKGRLFATQGSDDFAVVPDGKPQLMSLARGGSAHIETFGAPKGSVRLEDGHLVDHVSGMSIATAEVGLRGKHNLGNACAAALTARLIGIEAEPIVTAMTSFKGLPHRMEHVADVNRVAYIDDSKATNVGAAAASIEGLSATDGRIVLIAGGRDKGGSYAPLRAQMDRLGRALVLIGEAADLIRDAFSGSALEVHGAGSLEDAVQAASNLALPGDTVLLAPACSSYDMFASYVERGQAFQEAVQKLAGPT